MSLSEATKTHKKMRAFRGDGGRDCLLPWGWQACGRSAQSPPHGWPCQVWPDPCPVWPGGRGSLTRLVKEPISRTGGVGWSLESLECPRAAGQSAPDPLPPGRCVRSPRLKWRPRSGLCTRSNSVHGEGNPQEPGLAARAGPGQGHSLPHRSASFLRRPRVGCGPGTGPEGRGPLGAPFLPCSDRRQQVLGESDAEITVRTPESMHICFSVFVFRKKVLFLFSGFFFCFFWFFFKGFSFSSNFRAGSR